MTCDVVKTYIKKKRNQKVKKKKKIKTVCETQTTHSLASFSLTIFHNWVIHQLSCTTGPTEWSIASHSIRGRHRPREPGHTLRADSYTRTAKMFPTRSVRIAELTWLTAHELATNIPRFPMQLSIQWMWQKQNRGPTPKHGTPRGSSVTATVSGTAGRHQGALDRSGLI